MPTLKPMVLAEGERPRGQGFDPVAGQTLHDESGCDVSRNAFQRLVYRARGMVARRLMNALFEERVRERERIARELHDTLIQGAQALILSMHVLSARLAVDDPVRGSLVGLVRRAESVLAQGRARIVNLRESAGTGVDLATFLMRSWSGLRGEGDFHLRVEGPNRIVEPCVADVVSLIGREALSNALRHSKASRIEARVVLDESCLRLFVRDDGVGILPGVRQIESQLGHWGLPGMRERADELGATFEIRSGSGLGTDVRLIVPAKVAYGRGKGIGRRWLKRLLSQREGRE